MNSSNSIINIDDTRTLARGFSALFLDPRQPDPRVQDWNFTVEKELATNVVLKASYVGNHSDHIQQTINYNDSTPSYIWWAARKEPLPTGEFANVATRPYDQQVYGTINGYGMTGYTNYSGFQVELERRYSKGLRVPVLLGDGKHSGGHRRTLCVCKHIYARRRPHGFRRTQPVSQLRARPGHSQEHGPLELGRRPPVRKGQEVRRQRQRSAGKLIGGWQIAGLGQWRSNYWSLPSSNVYPTGQNDRDLRLQVSDRRLPQRRMLPRLPLVERLHPRQPDQQPRRAGPSERSDGCAAELQTRGRSADSLGLHRPAGQRSGQHGAQHRSGIPTQSGCL